jgi:hypothetical protein
MYSETVFADIRAHFVTNVRDEQRSRIRRAIGDLFRHHGFDSEKQLQSLLPQQYAKELEAKCYQLAYSKVDDAYKTRIENIVRNVQLLQRATGGDTAAHQKEISSYLFVKKKINIQKLILAHPRFRELVGEWSLKIEAIVDNKLSKLKPKESDKKQQSDAVELKKQEAAVSDDEGYFRGIEGNDKALKGPAQADKTSLMRKKEEEAKGDGAEDEEDQKGRGMDALDEVTAQFSSDDQEGKAQAKGDRAGPGASSLIRSNEPQPRPKPPVIKYNPLHVVQAFQDQNKLGGFGRSYHPPAHSRQPILYDPLTRKSHLRRRGVPPSRVDEKTERALKSVPEQALNSATPGSLLRVWSGKLDL